MNFPLLILRPTEAGQRTAGRARNLGLNPIVDPMFEIRSIRWSAASIDHYDAIMFTSPNGVKMAGPELQEYTGLPALAVGEATKKAAQDAGFLIVQTGCSGVQSLVDQLPVEGFNRVLRLSGKEFTPVQSNRSIEQVAVYEAPFLGLGVQAQTALAAGAVLLLHSARAAHHLIEEMAALGLDQSINRVVAISPKVAQILGKGWKSNSVADQPTDEALLTKAVRLCSGQTMNKEPE